MPPPLSGLTCPSAPTGASPDLDSQGDPDFAHPAEDGTSPAEQALAAQHLGWMTRRVRALARRYGLSPSDTEDAIQDSFFALKKAVARYDLFRSEQPCGCPFRAFLNRIVTDRVKDFAKHLRRRGRVQQFPINLEPGARARGEELPDHRPASNPAAAAERRELLGRFRAAADLLPPADRELLEMYLRGQPLRDMAAHLGLSYDAAKRRWRTLREHLAGALRRQMATGDL